MDLIAAVDKNFGLGKRGGLLFSIPEDMQYFKEKTLGRQVIMGRKTLLSLPGGKPLKGRENLILSRHMETAPEGVELFASREALFAYLLAHPKEESPMVIGGAEIYALLLPYCHYAYITRVDLRDEEADCFLTDLEALPRWRLKEISAPHEYEGLRYCFCLYENESPLPLTL